MAEKIPKGIPQVIKRCPKCKNLTLTYDPKENRIKCASCGFEQSFPR